MINSGASDAGVEAMLLTHVQQYYDNVALITGWIVVAEVMSVEGVPSLAAFASEGMPYWKINGMLEAAPFEIEYADEDEELD